MELGVPAVVVFFGLASLLTLAGVAYAGIIIYRKP